LILFDTYLIAVVKIVYTLLGNYIIFY